MTPVSFFPGSTLNALAWSALLAVPPAIVLLYFLKLRREPWEVPSTYLWRRAIEDLHVNSLWQRLRQSLLLFLQLLLAALIILACLQPGWRSSVLTGDRFILLLDTSASMQATDVPDSRIEAAKQEARRVVQRMQDGDAAMILSAANAGRVEQPYTNNRRLLRDRIDQVQVTSRPTDFTEALRYAAGLANPSRSSEDPSDVQVAEALPAALFIFSDGGFETIPDFSLGNLEPEYSPIGNPTADNLAIVAFTVQRNAEKPDQTQAYLRVENFNDRDVSANVTLLINGELADAKQLATPAKGEAGLLFDLPDVAAGRLQADLDRQDDLALDNVAFAVLNPPRRVKTLVVTPGNRYLRLALSTDEVSTLSDLTFAAPELLTTPAYQQQADSGQYDLIIFERCSPPRMPQASTLFLGSLPPAEQTAAAPADRQWTGGRKQGPPMITDADRLHPLLQFVELGDVSIAEGFPVTGPAGAKVLIDSDIGPLLTISPRGAFQDAVLGVEIIGPGDGGPAEVNTDWTRRRSFPVFLWNALTFLGGGGRSESSPSTQPGQPFVYRPAAQFERIEMADPRGSRTALRRDSQGRFVFAGTEQPGIYEIFAGGQSEPIHRFAVNLFDRRESDLETRRSIELGYQAVEGRAVSQPTRRELWRWLLVVGLVVLVFEWYIYNRRVYL